MKKSLLISARFDQPGLLEDFVEKLAWRRYEFGYCLAEVPRMLKAIESSSTETFVSGTVDIMSENEKIQMPFITRYLFTCMKERNGGYKLEGGFSLS